MKINKKKVMVSALAVAMGAALVGSISGTIAWYQYSTRVTTAMVGTSAGVSRNLQIRIKDVADANLKVFGDTGDNWRSEITTSEITSYLENVKSKAEEKLGDSYKETNYSSNKAMRPITTGEIKKDSAVDKFYGNPVYQESDEENWITALKSDYVEVTFEVRALKGDGNITDGDVANPALSEESVFLTDLTIQQKAVEGKKDISDAVRVHFSVGTNNYLLSKAGGETVTSSVLDVNNDGVKDTVYRGTNTHGNDDPSDDTVEDVKYDFQADAVGGVADVIYGKNTAGGAAGKQTAYSPAELIPAINNKGIITDSTPSKALFKTSASAVTEVTMKIWLEGWQKLVPVAGNAETTTGSIWDTKDYVGSIFNVGFTFATSAVERA